MPRRRWAGSTISSASRNVRPEAVSSSMSVGSSPPKPDHHSPVRSTRNPYAQPTSPPASATTMSNPGRCTCCSKRLRKPWRSRYSAPAAPRYAVTYTSATALRCCSACHRDNLRKYTSAIRASPGRGTGIPGLGIVSAGAAGVNRASGSGG
jgi:hypothetical protein